MTLWLLHLATIIPDNHLQPLAPHFIVAFRFTFDSIGNTARVDKRHRAHNFLKFTSTAIAFLKLASYIQITPQKYLPYAYLIITHTQKQSILTPHIKKTFKNFIFNTSTMLQDSPSPKVASSCPTTNTITVTTSPSSPSPMSLKATGKSAHLESFDTWGSSSYNRDPGSYPGVEEHTVALLQQLPRERAQVLYLRILEKQRLEMVQEQSREETLRFANTNGRHGRHGNGGYGSGSAKGGMPW